MSTNQDEFDVELAVKGLYRLLVKAMDKLVYPVRVAFYKPIKLVVAMVIAFGISFGLTKLISPVYRSEFTFKPMAGDDLFFMNQLNDIHQLVKDDDDGQLSALLNLPLEVTGSISYIDAKPVWMSARKDTIKLVVVQIKSKRKSDFDTIQKSLIGFIENSEHYARLKGMRQKQINLMRNKLLDDLNEIDSLKKLMAQSMLPRNAGGFVYGEPLDPVKLYDAGLALYKQQLSLNWQQEYINSFELTSPCIVSSKAAWPKFSYLVLASSLMVFILVGWHNHQNKKRN
ncbi:MAG: hypothetical protein K1X81_08130 [Bacteroidia bacterium]|nr:hypothetical protein [Bacteroidia bacterium]